MNRRGWWLAACGWGCLAMGTSLAQQKPEVDAEKQKVEALAIARRAARAYAMRVGGVKLELQADPVLRWSNPEVGNVYGNVFVWTRNERPLVVGSLFHWLAAQPTMEHEFHSLAAEPVSAEFQGEKVWETRESGVAFADIPQAPQPAASEAQRLLQLRQLAKEFTGVGKFGQNPSDQELRLLPQPIHRYAAPQEQVLAGGLFSFVRTTDPEILLIIEARSTATPGPEARSRWQFAAVRMHSTADLWLKHGTQKVWQAEPLEIQEIFTVHERPYTAFKFREIPESLK